MTDFLGGIDEFLATFTPEEQAVTRVVFRSLLEGRGIQPEAVAVTLGMSLTAVERAVDQLIERGTMERDTASGELAAARGLSLAETPHRLTLDGRRLYAFCPSTPWVSRRRCRSTHRSNPAITGAERP